MKLSDFDFELPIELIAQEPAEPRDSARLLVLDSSSGQIKHDRFSNLTDYLETGDVLVLNNSKVIPARLFGKKESGGEVEIFLNHQISENIWQVLGRKLKVGQKISFDDSKLMAKVVEKKDDTYSVEFNFSGNDFIAEIQKIGHTPLPPYIQRSDNKKDKQEYQTVYAKDNGSVAAPTAGLHFTNNLLDKIQQKNVELLEVTLHVGLGTFSPVKTDNIEDHQIHSEYYSVEKSILKKIIEAKKNGRRIIAVGTTTTRVLEHIFQKPDLITAESNISGWTNIFIYPGYKFKCVDGLITNFHLPKSSLLMLVSALAGKEKIDRAYKEAIAEQYRFFSYGDGMFIKSEK